MLKLQNLSFNYKRSRSPALSGVSAELSEPLVAVLGPNGAGKSTLFRVLATAATPSSGTFSLDGVDASGVGRAGYRRHLGWMPQQLGMFGAYTCAEFLRYIAWMRQVRVREIDAAVDAALAVVNLGDRATDQIRSLSGGMRQRIGLAQAIVADPKVLLLDEPTVGLDPRERAEFRHYLTELSARCQVILSTHLVDDVASLARQVLVLDRGVVAFTGSLNQMCGLERPSPGDVERAYLDLVPGTLP